MQTGCSGNTRVFVFDEAVSDLDPHTAEQFAHTINRLKSKVTIIFITHQLPKALQVDEAILLSKEKAEAGKDNAMTEVQKHGQT